MPSINEVFTSVPSNQLKQSEAPSVAKFWLEKDPEILAKFNRIASSSGVSNRHFIVPAAQTLSLEGLKQRSELFEELGEPLLKVSLEPALEKSGLEPSEFAYYIFTSCSIPIIPSLDAKMILNSNLSRTISRIPIFQHGCAAGVIGLALGCKLAKLGKPVVLSSLELCSLVFQTNDNRGSQLVGAAIFADGAASLVISPSDGKLNYIDSMSYLIPESREIMGYDLFDDGFHLRLSRELPSLLIKELPQTIDSFLNAHSLSKSDIDYWLFHPGGKKILDHIEVLFNLSPEQCHWARDVLRENGNMSSATILFVLNQFLKEGVLNPNQKVLIVGIGPGLTIELILFES